MIIQQKLAERLKHRRTDIIMKVSDTGSFGQAIKKRRKELKYTQSYISEVTGFSVSFISELENGKSTAEIGKAIFLANVLGLDIEISPRGNK